MKTIEQIINSEPVFLNAWKCQVDVLRDFFNLRWDDDISDEEVIEKYYKNILFASYGNEEYEGVAFVIFEKDGKLFEVNASHCSCYGLEDQWCDDDEIVLEEMKNRIEKGSLGDCEYSGNIFKDELIKFLGIKE